MRTTSSPFMAAACCLSLLYPVLSQAEAPREEALHVLEQSTAVLNEYFASPRMEAMRNLMGAAKAIYIAPELRQAGLVVGGTIGSGILLRRQGREWSDPVYLEARSVTVGFQAGAAELRYVAVLLTDAAVTALIAGDARASTGGGATLGPLGAGGGGSGGVGGVESLSFALSKGIYFGGNVGTTSLSLLDELNRAVYGAHFSQDSILDKPGGHLPQAGRIRTLLSEAVEKSWGDK